MYSGSCPSANPTRYTPTYYDSNPGFVTVDAGGSYSVSVRQPRTRVRFVKPGSTGTVNVVGGEVTVTSRDAGCTARFTLTTDEHGRVTKPTTSEYGFDPSLPFGRWAICGYDPAINKSRTVEINNTSAAGASTSTVVELGASARTGRCP